MPARPLSGSWRAAALADSLSPRAASSTSASPCSKCGCRLREPLHESRRPVLLINPAITQRSRARFPLSIMTMAAALEPAYESTLIDGNLDRNAIATAAARRRERKIRRGRHHGDGRAAGRHRHRDVARIAGCAARSAHRLGRLFPDPVSRRGAQQRLRGLRRARARRRNAARVARGAAYRGVRLSTPSAASALRRDGRVVRNAERLFSARHIAPRLRLRPACPIRGLPGESFLGARTAAHQAALGCRFRCTFCGVAAMFRGGTAPAAGAAARRRTRLSQAASSAPTRSSSTITISSTAKSTWCRCSRCWRATSCRGGATRAPTRW